MYSRQARLDPSHHHGVVKQIVGGGHVQDDLLLARSTGVLRHLPEELVEGFIEGAWIVDYPRGSIALRRHGQAQAGIVVAGLMGQFITSPSGAEMAIRYLRAGDFIGTLTPSHSRVSTSVEALSQARLLHLDTVRAAALAAREPMLAWALMEELVRVLGVLDDAIYRRSFGSMRLRVADALLQHAATAGPLTPGVAVEVTQQGLARAVGSVREVVAAELGLLRKEGVLSTSRGRIVIHDPAQLAMEARAGWSYV